MSIYVYVLYIYKYIYWSNVVEALFLYKKKPSSWTLMEKPRHEDIVYS